MTTASNQTAWKGVQDAMEQLDIEWSVLESQAENRLRSEINFAAGW